MNDQEISIENFLDAKLINYVKTESTILISDMQFNQYSADMIIKETSVFVISYHI